MMLSGRKGNEWLYKVMGIEYPREKVVYMKSER